MFGSNSSLSSIEYHLTNLHCCNDNLCTYSYPTRQVNYCTGRKSNMVQTSVMHGWYSYTKMQFYFHLSKYVCNLGCYHFNVLIERKLILFFTGKKHLRDHGDYEQKWELRFSFSNSNSNPLLPWTIWWLL